MKVLLLNPPARRLVLRDYFCSKVSQAAYVHPPIDLVFASGWMRDRFELELLDAIVERRSRTATLDRIATIRPDAVVTLVGAAAAREDLSFLDELRSVVGGPIVGIGDLLLERPTDRLTALPSLDAIATDFACDGIARFLDGERGAIAGVAHRGALPLAAPAGEFELPVPRHDLFLARTYRYGLSRGRRLASVLTDFGCPYRCTFCVMPGLGWRRRPIANVIDELDELARLGARELFFLDQTFGLPKRRALELLAAMERRRYAFGWVAFARADTSDDELLAAMRRAGCHTVVFGVESGDEGALVAMSKELTTTDVRSAVARARRAGLRVATTILLGMPDETEATFEATMRLVAELDPDFLSVNVAVPRNGTALRAEAMAEGLAADPDAMDQSGTSVALRPRALDRDDVAAMRRRAISAFYMRPRYVARRALAVRSLGELRLLVENGLAIARSRA